MFNPIIASEKIKQSFVDYITTVFGIDDKVYMQALRDELRRENTIAKGPYLDIGAS